MLDLSAVLLLVKLGAGAGVWRWFRGLWGVLSASQRP